MGFSPCAAEVTLAMIMGWCGGAGAGHGGDD